MPDITVLHGFHLIRDDGTERVFKPGVYSDISERDLNHWWVKANIGHAPTVAARPTSYEYEQLTPQQVVNDRAVRFIQATEETQTANDEAEFKLQMAERRLDRQKRYDDLLTDVRQGGYDKYLEMVKEQEDKKDPVYIAKASDATSAAEENGDQVTATDVDGEPAKNADGSPATNEDGTPATTKKTPRAVLAKTGSV
jgi:hypothetical protein